MKRLHVSPLFLFAWGIMLLFNDPADVFALFLAALIHESAHFAAFLLLGAPVEKVELLSFGASVRLSGAASLSATEEIIVSLAGIAANLASAAAVMIFPGLTVCGGRIWVITCHVMLAAVNLIPIEPLDGGRALYFFLLKRLDPSKARHVTRIVGFVFLIPLGFFSVWLLAETGYNFSLLCVVLYLFLSLLSKKTE